MKKLSVIVPVYNAEKFLERCVKSILNQTYSNIELILVNDGSKDNSLALCNKLATEDPRIVVIDKSNGGAASARNKGIEVATGDYIGFCDSDDFLDLDMFETLISIMEKENLPTIECLSKVYDENFSLVESDNNNKQLNIKDAEQAIKDIFMRKGGVHLGTRVTESKYIKKVFIPEGRRVEDFYFTIKLLLQVGKTAVYNYPFYNYTLSSGSVTRSTGGSIYVDALYFYDKARADLIDSGFDLEDAMNYYLFKMYYLLSISFTKSERKKFSMQIRAYKKDLRIKKKLIIADKYLTKKEKLVLKLASFSFSITRFLYLIKN